MDDDGVNRELKQAREVSGSLSIDLSNWEAMSTKVSGLVASGLST